MSAHPPTVTLLFAGLSGLLAVFLGARVTALRFKLRINVGDGGNEKLIQTIRVHANNAEYSAIGLVIIGLCEIAAGGGWAIWALAGGLFAGRVLHAQGMIRTTAPHPSRIVGQTLTWLTIALAGVYAIYLFVRLYATGTPAT